MKNISLRSFQLKPTKYLKDLPIGLTRYGILIAILSYPTGNKFYDPDPRELRKLEKAAKGPQKKRKISLKGFSGGLKMCKHGSAVGLCKYGCKK